MQKPAVLAVVSVLLKVIAATAIDELPPIPSTADDLDTDIVGMAVDDGEAVDLCTALVEAAKLPTVEGQRSARQVALQRFLPLADPSGAR
jgi:hypothetical protein